jgi:hypothetical protein
MKLHLAEEPRTPVDRGNRVFFSRETSLYLERRSFSIGCDVLARARVCLYWRSRKEYERARTLNADAASASVSGSPRT